MISIFVATSGRPTMFRAMLESLRVTKGEHEVEVVAAIDADPVAWDVANEYGVRVWYKSSRRGALNAWNDAFTMAAGDLLVPAGDDQVFHPGWLDYALDAHRTRVNGSGVVGMNDLAYNGNTQVATMFLFDRAYCKEHMGGVFAPPCYDYLCVDLEWNDKAKMLGKFYWCEESIVEHLHSAHGKRPFDELDAEKDSAMHQRDTKTFEDRKSRGFPVEWSSLI